jgi:signal transduction histidine kinase
VDRRLLLRLIAPPTAIGLLLLGACLAGVLYTTRLQRNLANVLSQNVASLQVAQELEIRVRQLRFHNLLYFLEPTAARLSVIENDQFRFEEALAKAHETANTGEQRQCVLDIENGYERYQRELAQLRTEIGAKKTPLDLNQVTEAHPIRHVTDHCQRLLELNRSIVLETTEETQRATHRGNAAMLLLGLFGPVAGIALGYGVARGLSRSIYRLSVRVQDAAQRLDRDIGSVNLVADGDMQRLDRQLQHIVVGVEEVVDRLQQQQRELLRTEQLSAVGKLAAGVAHEVRNPLAGIKLLVESAIASNNRKPLNIEDLRVIYREIARLEQTVQSFLDLARPTSPRLARCNLRQVISEAAELVRTRAKQAGVELDLPAGGPDVTATADPAQLCTVLLNLFLNAIDAMPAGGRLQVMLLGAPSHLRILVCDTGPGISSDILSRLFTPFVTSKPTGTGLGLTVSRRIIEQHGGSLTGSNRAGAGACFEITLPTAENDHAENPSH